MVKQNNLVYKLFIFAALALLVIRCATPTQPSGGDPDDTGPVIYQTIPEDGTINFDGDELVFEFEDYVERGTFQRAFSIQPELGIDYEVSWSRRTATVKFESELPDTTTIAFYLSTDLTDMRNNNMQTGFRMAVSTGPEIDDGEIHARVIDGNDGSGMENERVLLYREPFDLEVPADYIAQADEEGSVEFNYLREGTYKAFWVDDRNRNRIWDSPQESAQPFSKETVDLGDNGQEDFGTLFIQQVDSIPPEVIGVGLYNPQRLRLRFDENISMTDTTEVTVTDEEREPLTSALPLYAEPGNRNIMFARSDQPLDPDEQHLLDLRHIYDNEGNEAVFGADPFSGSDEADTTLQRLIRHDTENGIREDEPLQFRFADVIDEDDDMHAMIRDSLEVVVTDTAITGWDYAEIEDNLLRVYPDGFWDSGETYTIRLWNPGRMDRQEINPQIWYEDDLGELELIVEEPSSEEATHVYSLINNQGDRVERGSFHDELILEELPPGQYTVQVFEDKNGDGRWFAGTVDPYEEPEPYFVESDVAVESGLTGQVFITLGEPPEDLEEVDEEPEAPEDEFPEEN